MSWLADWKKSVRTPGDLEKAVSLEPEEREYWETPGHLSNLPMAISAYYLSLFAGKEPAENPPLEHFEALRRQCVPRKKELEVLPYENADPLGEGMHSPLPRLVHQYPNRVLIKTTDHCALYCRHCFRRRFAGGRAGALAGKEIDDIAAYLQSHREVREILLSGGDCLMLSNKTLFDLMDRLEPRQAPEDRRVFRLCSRIPVVLPSRINRELMAGLKKRRPLWLVTQVNHPLELTPESRKALDAFVDSGIPVVNQAVLLRGVNDDPEILADLFQKLVAGRVKPGYLFQGDLAPGTFHFRVGLDRGLSIVEALQKKVSGLAMPCYAVDLPGGGGKTILYPSKYLRDEEDPSGQLWRVFPGRDGREYRYPLEKH